MDPGLGARQTYKETRFETSNFSEEKFVGTFQFGRLYRGYSDWLGQDVMVKVWEFPETYGCSQEDNLFRMLDEFILLQHERLLNHPGMVEFYKYCWDGEHLCALYKFSPLDTVHNLVPKDSFTWLQRIKVALGIAQVLKFLHSRSLSPRPFLVRNVAAAHFVVDEEYNPKLYDLGMVIGGIFLNRMPEEGVGCYGYVDPNIGCSGEWSEKTDVFAFGVVLLNLITKRLDTEEDRRSNAPLLYLWAWDHHKSWESEDGSTNSTNSLVDQSLTMDPNFSVLDGCEVTNLAMKCISRIADERPTMKQVVKDLLKLQVTKKNGEVLGLPTKL